MVHSAWHEHAPFAYWLVDALRPRSIVELGTHAGFSFFVFCEAIKRLNLDASAYALDTWEGDDHAGTYNEDVFEYVSSVRDKDYRGFAHLLRGTFDEKLADVADGTVDLLHIDGRHGYEDVKRDFESWLPKVSDRGIVILHDTAEHQEGFGVWKFWAEISQKYPAFAFEHGHGLGVLAVGPNAPAAVQRLIEAGIAAPEDVRRTYATLGAAITAAFNLELRIVQSESRIHELESESAQLRRELRETHSSASWRITRPLRALKTFLRVRR